MKAHTTEFDSFVAAIITVRNSVTLSVWINTLRTSGTAELIGSTCHLYTARNTNITTTTVLSVSVFINPFTSRPQKNLSLKVIVDVKRRQ